MLKRIVLLTSLAQSLIAQVQVETKENTALFGIKKRTLVTYSLLAYTAGSLYTEYQWWWKGNYHSFKYENDGLFHNYSLGVDKVGHFYTSYFYFSSVYEIMKWADFDESEILIGAVSMPFIHALSIEIGDGFSTHAFSGVDLVANICGIGYGLLQKRIPFLENFKFKWSYYPSGYIPFDDGFRITDDYDGHIYWLSWNVHSTLPEGWKQYWVRYLNVAVGYGGYHLSARPAWVGTPIVPTGKPARKFAISLDYNLSAIDIEKGFLSTLRNIIDYFHYPSPGVRYSEEGKPKAKLFIIN